MMSNPCNTNTKKDSSNPPWQYFWLTTNPRHKYTYHTKNYKHKVKNRHKQNTPIEGQHCILNSNVWPDQTNNNRYRQTITFIHNTQKVLQPMNLNGLWKFDTPQQAYLFEYSNKPVNCSHILVFLKQSACYTVDPDTCQWYRINANEITNNYTIAICNEDSINMVPLPPAEPSEFNAFGTIARLSLSQNQMDLCNNIHTKPSQITLLYLTIT